MSAFKQTWSFLRRQLKGWDRYAAIAWRGMSRRIAGLFLAQWAWWRARSWIYLTQGLPALAAGIAVVVLLTMYLTLPAHEIEARYQDRAAAASKAKEFAIALVCYERLAALGKDRPGNLYEMAIALEAQGQPVRAQDIMNQIAQADQNGYGPAHQWQAIRHWRSLGNPKDRKLAEAHLISALEAGIPDPDAAHGLLGELYLQSGKPEKAEPHLERAVKTRPHVRLRYAQALAAQGKKARASDEGKLAASYFRTRAQADVKDKFTRVAWAECVTFLEEFPQALAILADGYHLSNDADYKLAMARVYLAWHFQVVASAPDEIATQWSLLEQGLQLDSANVRLLDRLVFLMGKGGDDADKARAVMHKVLAKGEATGTAHFLLGMDAWQRGEKAQAEIHWERGYQLSPNLPVLANNLAWLLAHAANGDPLRALQMIDQVIEKFPQEPSYRDTRAHVCMKLARWREALVELEWVQQRVPNSPTVHSDLAEVYGQLGMKELAVEHRRLADARDKKRKSPN
jgi:tetratricopeptide (TPR) repeat protein